MAIPSYFKRLFREYVTGVGSSEVASQAPVQSVNSQTGDVTITDTGGTIPSDQTVATYNDLPLTGRSQAEFWYVTNKDDIVVSTQLSPVQWRSVSDYTLVAAAVPDTQIDRPDDDSGGTTSSYAGLVINPNVDMGGLKAIISANNTGSTQAYLFDSSVTLLDSVAVSGTGTEFSLSGSMTSSEDHYLVTDDGGNSYTYGSYNPTSYPLTGQAFDVVDGVVIDQSNNVSFDSSLYYNVDNIRNLNY